MTPAQRHRTIYYFHADSIVKTANLTIKYCACVELMLGMSFYVFFNLCVLKFSSYGILFEKPIFFFFSSRYGLLIERLVALRRDVFARV